MTENFFTPPSISEKVLLFDGLGRAGKMLISPLVGEFPNVEWPQNMLSIDNAPALWRMNAASADNTAAFLRLLVNAAVYERAIGRHMNSRADDIYSIHRCLDWQGIDGRRFGPEGDIGLNNWLALGRHASFITHHQLPLWPVWFAAFPEIHFIICTRHPIDTWASWMRKGWGTRIGEDRLDFTLMSERNGAGVPWFLLDCADEFANASPEEKVAHCIVSLNDMYEDAYAELPEKHRDAVRFVPFEIAATEPDRIFGDLATWLGTTLPEEWEVAKARERVARKLDMNTRRQKFSALSAAVSGPLLDNIVRVSRRYEEQWGLPPV